MSNYSLSNDRYSAFALLKLVVDNKDFKKAMDATGKGLEQLAKKCLYIGQNLETVGRSLVAPLSAATAVFSDFDDKMRRVAAVTGAGRAATVATPKEAAEIFKALAGGMGR